MVYWSHQEDGMKNETDWESLAFDVALIWSWPLLLAAAALGTWLT